MVKQRQGKLWGYKPTAEHKRYYGGFELAELNDRFEIWCLSILEKHRNQGHATQMLTEFLAQFKFEKPLYLYVYKTNEIAIRLYKKVGFAIIGDYKYGDYAYTMQYVGT